ncbi:BTAD domain-containing putative transcriptional regulator [Thermus filiformis]|uniref:Transcriptional regulator n=1 Tax=Thermus filiformis TaxID=276 RepID=A0A0A2WMD5_THEFI|nr:BTAD domain-containing putative transcriptional regulator [Thermus filiformis]KGQ21341.2 transcriptional regulator [Thermus filiformis]
MALAWQSPVYLRRERLLSLLPTAVGFAVCLEAPAGFGKSVLAGQLAESLPFRALWGSALLDEPKALLARALGLPRKAPWGVVLEALGEAPSLVVLEDLKGDEDLSPLLRTLPCLLVLASRKPLPYPELPKLLAEGRLVRLGAGELAFTPEEAQALFGGRGDYLEAHRATGGWPLPLFLAAFTGRPPEPEALLRGLRESLAPEEFQEGLLLAALPHLPEALARPETEGLFQKGLLGRTPEGYRLHALLKEMALRSLLSEVQKAVREAQGRLPPVLLAEAYANSGLWDDLLALLESPLRLPLPPERLLAWEGLLRRGGPRARLRLAEALLASGRREGFVLLEALTAEEDPRIALRAHGNLAYYLAEPLLGQDLPRARAHLEQGMALLDRVGEELAGRFLNDVARVPYEEGKPLEALALLEEALRRLPPESPYRVAPLVNAAFLAFELRGDLEGRIRALEEGAPLVARYTLENLPGNLRDLGRLYLLLGEKEKAKSLLKRAKETPGNPLAALEAGMLLAHLEGDAAELQRLLARAELWESPYLVARGKSLLALLLREPRLLEGVEGFLSALARAELKGDAALLPPYPEEREERLYWHALRYRLLGQEADLEALLSLTLSRERVLPGLLPLEALPRHRAELARAYPLEAVLRSGWKEAVRLRLDEVPPLRVEVLGRFRLEGPLGEVALAGRLRELFALLLLGLSREEAAFALWPDFTEEAARNNLAVSLSRLRKALEPWGVATYLGEEGLCRLQVDLWALEEALDREDAEAAYALYRGPAFPGLDHPLLDRKREEVAARLRALFLRTGEARYLERLLELDPLDEEALWPLVEEHLRRGRSARALRLLRRFCQAFREELGEEPPSRALTLLRGLEG